MFDIQHDSPVPIHEQITSQIRAHVASGALAAGAVLAEYRAFAQELLTNPQVVARAYADLQEEGVLAPFTPDPPHPLLGKGGRGGGGSGEKLVGGMAVTAAAGEICRARLRETAREQIRLVVGLGVAWGLDDVEIVKAVELALAASKVRPLSQDEILQAMKKPTYDSSHRASQGIQDLSRDKGPGFS
jgi:Bacterial regulatory proteins, gntR family